MMIINNTLSTTSTYFINKQQNTTNKTDEEEAKKINFSTTHSRASSITTLSVQLYSSAVHARAVNNPGLLGEIKKNTNKYNELYDR